MWQVGCIETIGEVRLRGICLRKMGNLLRKTKKQLSGGRVEQKNQSNMNLMVLRRHCIHGNMGEVLDKVDALSNGDLSGWTK